MAGKDDTVFIVIRDVPDIFTEIERVFLDEINAHDYIIDTYPYFSYYPDDDIYAMPDLEGEELEKEERYYVKEMPISD